MLNFFKEKSPIILNLANTVTQQRVADSVSYIGASPIMLSSDDEAENLMNISDAVVFNLGTLNSMTTDICLISGKVANQQNKPVVIDPVAVSASKLRQDSFHKLSEQVSFDVIRGNIAEIAFISNQEWDAKGIDAGQGTGNRQQIVELAAKKFNAIVVASGEKDIISDGISTYEAANGSSMMATNVGMGDALDAVIGSFIAINYSIESVLQAITYFNVSGELAAEKYPNQPQSFSVGMFDNVFNLEENKMKSMQKIKRLL
ncbi:hydroxyethylthiazole kinase [Lactobacillus sp. S2-2]|uniref:hydroxyethylthiazole kinase n=1 Tax=Lactobacillus sp. S2-2 TaxID=2692917 RepID=UPI001F019300|nr:hydroxyethylthiazole kinase [Lactobacillus sp. S2-2]MCF6514693.1 hydroxyethylthiazole kinase [Lactobacillus sp. S2-2]